MKVNDGALYCAFLLSLRQIHTTTYIRLNSF